MPNARNGVRNSGRSADRRSIRNDRNIWSNDSRTDHRRTTTRSRCPLHPLTTLSTLSAQVGMVVDEGLRTEPPAGPLHPDPFQKTFALELAQGLREPRLALVEVAAEGFDADDGAGRDGHQVRTEADGD
ncbi:MAG TPA: hypothetical protein DEQ61_15720 [Streptomyces sp.]|nr:hypothetical protein [Streptomyces sp.]